MRVDLQQVFEKLRDNKIEFFTGVPDSLLKELSSYIETNVNTENHIVAANEGNAIGIATGRYLATHTPACVYMQNSGFGNAINPLLSLADPSVFSIPMLIFVGWRGEPSTADEVQHQKQGSIMQDLLLALQIPFFHSSSSSKFLDVLQLAINKMMKESRPVVLLISKDTFDGKIVPMEKPQDFPMTRARALELVIENLSEECFTVSTTGFISRELFNIRSNISGITRNDFMMVGSMGHASSIAFGLATANPQKKIVCLDGDGAALMHLGALPVAAQIKSINLFHIVINNGVHGSVGNQSTVAQEIDLCGIALSSGYLEASKVMTEEDLVIALKRLSNLSGIKFLEILVNTEYDENLKRPTVSPKENKNSFMEAFHSGSN
jgi:phosphonopyruvate decarboxylase